jgi:predicted small metal-binding protein
MEATMVPELVTVRCACGWATTGSEDEVVAATIEHGQTVHNMTATREQVLAMAVEPVDAGDTSGPAQAKA